MQQCIKKLFIAKIIDISVWSPYTQDNFTFCAAYKHMEGTRLRILQLLQKHGNDTVDGLARSIGLAPATIRRHLDILQRDRLVAFEQVRKRTGRPEYSFYLTESGQEALPKGYDTLLRMVVQELSSLTEEDGRSKSGQQILELMFLRMSTRITQQYEVEPGVGDFDSRLATLTQILEQENFYPEAEVKEGTLRIRLLNCPFRSVALENRGVCTFDQSLISSMLGVDALREECIHDDDNGCVYSAVVGSGAQV